MNSGFLKSDLESLKIKLDIIVTFLNMNKSINHRII